MNAEMCDNFDVSTGLTSHAGMQYSLFNVHCCGLIRIYIYLINYFVAIMGWQHFGRQFAYLWFYF